MSTHEGLPDSYRRIWAMVRRVPLGRVTTYGRIAQLCRIPRAARLVGSALRSLPPGSDVPWHRVVNAQGRIALPRRSPGGHLQEMLLEKEGVRVLNGKVRLAAYVWPRDKGRR